ncbi:MAG TPA: sugar ABC transporter permease [Gaiellaceae bacterium]|jgi:raffinose/stachyose/melibiose transport system permease protein
MIDVGELRVVPRSWFASRSRVGLGASTWWFVAPALALYAFIVLIPTVRGSYYSFTDWDGLNPVKHWVGLDNFTKILHDAAARDAIKHTVLIAVAITLIQNAVGLLLALGVNAHIKSRYILRVILFAPAVMTPVVVAFLWQYLYTTDGAINRGLAAVGLGGLQQAWLGDPGLALWCIVLVIIWQFAGYSMVIFLAGLQAIPHEVMEAALVDGAGPFRKFWFVTRPLIAPAITVNLMLSIIGGLKLFDQVWVLTGGGPGYATETLSTLIYRSAFQFGEFAYSTSLALLLAIFVAVVSSGQYRILRRQEYA